MQGLAFDPERGSPLVGLIVPARAVGNRAGGAVRLLARPRRRRRRAGAGRLHGAGRRPRPPSRRRPGARDGRRAARVLPLVFENELAIVDAASGRRARAASRLAAWRRSARSSAATAGTAWVSHWGGRWPEGRRSDAADRHRAERRSRRRRRARHRLDRHDRAHRSRDARGDGDGRRRLASDGARLGRGASAALRRQRQQRHDLGGRHRGGARRAHDRAEAVRPDARRRGADRAGAGAGWRDALRRARRVERRRGDRHRRWRHARADSDGVVSEPSGASRRTASSSPSRRCSASARAPS